jgi:hypothetical protein
MFDCADGGLFVFVDSAAYADDSFEAALPDQEIYRIRRVSDTIRPSPAVGPRHRSAVFLTVKVWLDYGKVAPKLAA